MLSFISGPVQLNLQKIGRIHKNLAVNLKTNLSLKENENLNICEGCNKLFMNN